MLDSLQSPSGTSVPPPVLLDTGDGDTVDPPTIQEEVRPPSISICLSGFVFFFKFPISVHMHIFLPSPNNVRNQAPRFNIVFWGKSLSNHAISNNVAGF